MLSFFLQFFPFLGLDLAPKPDIYAGGDVMISRSIGTWLNARGVESLTDGYNPFVKATKNDFTLVNLESPFSLPHRDKHEATFIFGANPKNASVLTWLRGESTMVVSLANNHIMNRGFAGLQKTIETLDSQGFNYIGTSKGTRKKYLPIEKAGKKYCFGAYSYDGRSYLDTKTQTMWYVNRLYESLEDVDTMMADKCDFRIIMLHWGREYRRAPTEYQRELAHTLVDKGATMIIGAHSHIFGETEQYQDSQIFYSLGNFIFDQEWGGKGCRSGMDCIFDKKNNKKIVPTNIGTVIHSKFPYRSFQKWNWYIKSGKFIEIEGEL